MVQIYSGMHTMCTEDTIKALTDLEAVICPLCLLQLEAGVSFVAQPETFLYANYLKLLDNHKAEQAV